MSNESRFKIIQTSEGVFSGIASETETFEAFELILIDFIDRSESDFTSKKN